MPSRFGRFPSGSLAAPMPPPNSMIVLISFSKAVCQTARQDDQEHRSSRYTDMQDSNQRGRHRLATEVADRAHVTVVSEAYDLIETEQGGETYRAKLWDTPGFGSKQAD